MSGAASFSRGIVMSIGEVLYIHSSSVRSRVRINFYLKFDLLEVSLKVQVPFFQEGVLDNLNFGLLLSLSSQSQDFFSKPDDFVGLFLVEAVKLVIILLRYQIHTQKIYNSLDFELSLSIKICRGSSIVQFTKLVE